LRDGNFGDGQRALRDRFRRAQDRCLHSSIVASG
jgi:hypothetical protein